MWELGRTMISFRQLLTRATLVQIALLHLFQFCRIVVATQFRTGVANPLISTNKFNPVNKHLSQNNECVANRIHPVK